MVALEVIFFIHMKKTLNIGSRKSPLALAQVDLVIASLRQYIPDFDAQYEVGIVSMLTSGDRFLADKLSEVGGKGLFTKEVDEALLAGDADITVHSAKDMPTELPNGICWPCVLPREDVRDYYISHAYPALEGLPAQATIGTASLRRELWMRQVKPEASIVPIRGNVGTRLSKLEAGEVDATILAAAGLNRLGITPPGHPLPVDPFIPSPGQGIIAIHCREDDAGMKALLASIHCQQSYMQGLIERQLMRLLDGSCRTPIAAYAQINGDHFQLHAMLGDEQSKQMVVEHTSGEVSDYEDITAALAEKLKAML